MNLVILAIVGFVTVMVGLLVLVLSLRWMNTDDLSSRLESYIEEPSVSSREFNQRVSEVREGS